MLKFFRKIQVTDRELSQVQDQVAAILQPLSKLAILDGVLQTYDLANGANKLNHGLTRTPLGWIVVDRTTAATVYRTAWDSDTMTLTSSGTNTVKLYIF